MSAKTDQLRNRLSINPDEAPPAPPPQERTDTKGTAPNKPTTTVASEGPELAKTQLRRSERKQSDVVVLDALADPDIHVGRKGYRSFYIDDEAFARFRAAIHWSSRHPDAVDEVPENMSVAVETWMLNTARDLERRYNDGEVFRMPPKTTRRPRTKK
jgi:hypothetical protein